MNIYGQLVAIRVQNKDFWPISANFFPNQKPTQQTKLRLNDYEILERPEDLEDHHPVHHHRAHRHHQLVLCAELHRRIASHR
jgi:hypothetical protein